LGRSPDNGDAFCQFSELMVRKGLLGGTLVNPQAKQWQAVKKLALKASSRYSESREYTHV